MDEVRLGVTDRPSELAVTRPGAMHTRFGEEALAHTEKLSRSGGSEQFRYH